MTVGKSQRLFSDPGVKIKQNKEIREIQSPGWLTLIKHKLKSIRYKNKPVRILILKFKHL